MKANPYDWLKQSREHRAYGAQRYPVMAGIASRSNGYPAFAMQVQAMPPAQRQAYVREWQSWRHDFGRAWDRLGCVKERRLGQYTDKYRESSWTPNLGQLGQGGKIRRGMRHVLGAMGADEPVGNRPPPPMGHSVFQAPPEGAVTWTGPWIAVPGYPLWTSRPANVQGYQGVSYIYLRADLGDKFMTSAGIIEAPSPSVGAPGMGPAPVSPPAQPAQAVAEKGKKGLWAVLLIGGGLIALGLRGMRKKGKR